MTQFTVRKMLLLQKRLRNLYKDSTALFRGLVPEDRMEVGRLIEAISIKARYMYDDVSEATRGLSWPSEREKREPHAGE